MTRDNENSYREQAPQRSRSRRALGQLGRAAAILSAVVAGGALTAGVTDWLRSDEVQPRVVGTVSETALAGDTLMQVVQRAIQADNETAPGDERLLPESVHHASAAELGRLVAAAVDADTGQKLTKQDLHQGDRVDMRVIDINGDGAGDKVEVAVDAHP